jgi:hypothetical protein
MMAMFNTHQATLSSIDNASPKWSELELAHVEASANDLAPAWQPPSRDAKAARKTFFVDAIKDWIATRRLRPGAYMSLRSLKENTDRFLLLHLPDVRGNAAAGSCSSGRGAMSIKLQVSATKIDGMDLCTERRNDLRAVSRHPP